MGCGSLTAEGAALIGATIGAVATIVGNIITHWLGTRKDAKLDAKRKERLRYLLSGDKHVWRNIETLSAAIGTDKDKTASLLIEIDARASMTSNGSWALLSRKPFPDDFQPEN